MHLVGVANMSGHIQPIGSLRANPFGLHDVHGNVWEWCGDTRDSIAPPRACDGLRNDGVEGSAMRSMRGGCFGNEVSDFGSAASQGHPPEMHSVGIGLRPARRITP